MGDADKKMKIQFLQSAKSRVILAVVLIVVVIAAIAMIAHWRSTVAANAATAAVAGAPDIASTPGAGNPSAAYVKAQEQVNVKGEEAARKAATSYIPTITRPGFVGNPDQFGQTDSTSTAHCPINKVVLMYKPNPAACTPENLKSARESGVTAEELMCQGCSCPLIKSAGYSVGDLKQIGMTATQLRACGFNLQELISAGFDAADLKAAGFNAQELKTAGFSAGELKGAGFSEADLKNAGYTPTQLKNAGFDATSQSAAASAADMKGTDPQSPDCNIDKLKQERAAGISATELRQRGCGLVALKAAGFSAGALKEAGFTAADLKAAGFTASALKGAGFSAADLKNAGFSAAALKEAGFSAGALKDAGFTAGQLVSAGFSANQLKNAGYSAAELKDAGFSAADLKAAGYSAGQLASAGFSPAALKAAGFTASQLRNAGVNAAALKAAGFSAADLKAAGSTGGDLSRAGFAAADVGAQTDEPDNAAPALPSINSNSPEAKLAAFEKQQQKDMSEQQRQDHIQRLQALMSQQANLFMAGSWSNFTTQQLQKAPAEQKSTSSESSSAAAAALGKNANLGGPIIKAGSVLFAVIQTSINSDENTPIMAHIVAGQLRGSKLLGTFTRVHKRLLINFSVLSDPHYPNSIPINAVAIDPDTARTALSGRVNSHYLLRYGTLFASSFLEGISQGIMNQGVTSDCLFGGFGCTLQQNPLSPTQQVMVGFGKVGQAYGQHMGESFNRAPTIRIAAGTGIGVLIMGDLNMPPNPQPNQSQQE